MSRVLFVSDMDGTLLNSDVRVSPLTSHIITRLSQQDALITVATARTPGTVAGLLKDTLINVPAIVMTGAALWHTDTNTYSDVRFIPSDQYAVIDEIYARAGVSPFIYTLSDDHILHVYHTEAALSAPEKEFVDERRHLALKKFHIGQMPVATTDTRRILQFAMGTEKAVRDTADALRDATYCQVSFYRDTYSDMWILEVFAPGVSKAAAVTAMRQRLGADKTVVYGDNLNDLPMMAVADIAIAVDNALPQVRQAADVVIGSHDTDAVARSMEHLFATL